MALAIKSKTINGFEMYAVMLGEVVLGSAWSERGARTMAAELLNKIKSN
jgi:hypothetical protein